MRQLSNQHNKPLEPNYEIFSVEDGGEIEWKSRASLRTDKMSAYALKFATLGLSSLVIGVINSNVLMASLSAPSMMAVVLSFYQAELSEQVRKRNGELGMIQNRQNIEKGVFEIYPPVLQHKGDIENVGRVVLSGLLLPKESNILWR